MSDDINDNGEDATLNLPPIKRTRQTAAPAAPPAEASPADALAAAFAKALAGVVAPKVEPVRYPPPGEVRMIANKPFHIAAEHLGLSEIAGSAHGMDGMGRQLFTGDAFSINAAFVDRVVDTGLARVDRTALASATGSMSSHAA